MDRCLAHYEGSHQDRSFGTLYCGSLGPRVYLRYRMAQRVWSTNPGDASTLLDKALQLARSSTEYEYQRLQESSQRRITLLEGPFVDSRALLTVILHQKGQTRQAREEAASLIAYVRNACQSLPASECEVLYGRAGALQVILFLRDELGDTSLGSEVVVELACDILREGKRTAAAASDTDLLLLWTWHGTRYLGAAHGVVGILQALLSVERFELLSAMNSVFPNNGMTPIQDTVDKLAEYCWPSGNLYSSIESSQKQDRLVHWCHGAPGHVLLLKQAAGVFGETRYLEMAKRIASDVVWQRGLLRKGVGLCHGIAGNAYVFLSLGKTDERWVDNAHFFAHFAMEHLPELELQPDRPYSTFEGLAGLSLLLLDLADPASAKFPLYEH
jgi:Lanthionine synthetase C-like protein